MGVFARPLSGGNQELQKRRSVSGGFTGTRYTGHTGHKRMQSAMIIGTKINAVGCMEEDLQAKTPYALKNKRVRGK